MRIWPRKKRRGGAVGELLESVPERAQQLTEEVGPRVRRGARAAREAVPAAARQAGEQARPLVQRGVEALIDAVRERVIESLPQPIAEATGRRRRRRRRLPLILAVLAGVGAGAGLGLVLLRRRDALPPAVGDVTQRLSAGMRTGAERARSVAQAGVSRARQMTGRGAGQPEARAAAVPLSRPWDQRREQAALSAGVPPEETPPGAPRRRAVAQAQGLVEGLTARWREAAAAGREAADEKQAELRREYLEDTKRI